MLQPIRHITPIQLDVFRFSLVTEKENKIIGAIVVVPHQDGWLMIFYSYNLDIIKDRFYIQFITKFEEIGNHVYYLNHCTDIKFDFLDYKE